MNFMPLMIMMGSLQWPGLQFLEQQATPCKKQQILPRKVYTRILEQMIHLYQLHPKLIDINCFYFPFFSKENFSMAMAMQKFYFSIKENTFQFINLSFGNVIGITKVSKSYRLKEKALQNITFYSAFNYFIELL